MKIGAKHVAGIVLGLIVLVGGTIFLRDNTSLLYFVAVVGSIVIALPFIIDFVAEQGVKSKKEEKFLEFTRDLVESVKSGTPIAKSIVNAKDRDYGLLSSHVQKLANQINLGITLTDALYNFAQDTHSRIISRAVGLISEAERAGGNIEVIIESVSNSVNQTEVLRKERKSSISNLVVQGYIIFFVFIGIMIVLDAWILPMTSGLAGVDTSELLGSTGISMGSGEDVNLSTPLLIMILVQSVFAGLVIGVISEGSILSGVKHSFVLVVVALLATTAVKALGFGGMPV